MATSGIAGTLLPGGTTVHAKLRVPISLTETSKCSYKDNSGTADMVKKGQDAAAATASAQQPLLVQLL